MGSERLRKTAETDFVGGKFPSLTRKGSFIALDCTRLVRVRERGRTEGEIEKQRVLVLFHAIFPLPASAPVAPVFRFCLLYLGYTVPFSTGWKKEYRWPGASVATTAVSEWDK